MNYFIYTSHHFTPHGRYELNKLTPLPICCFIAQLVEQRTGNAEVTGSRWSPDFFFQASSFQLLELENLLRWSFFTFTNLLINLRSRNWLIQSVFETENNYTLQYRTWSSVRTIKAVPWVGHLERLVILPYYKIVLPPVYKLKSTLCDNGTSPLLSEWLPF